jgi:NAD(P)-dependent dehydrogenase (short-subunit alcohol dehydrogenase family)
MGAASTKESKHYGAFEAALPSLEGKTVAITGCTTGTGYVTAVFAARKGADQIFLLNRSSDRATKAEESIRKEIAPGSKTVIETIPCDLQDFASVRAAAASIQSKCTKLDVLCNNAGVMALDDMATKDGYDIQMQTNHLSHFLLTKELFPLLLKSADARIVQHSSMARTSTSTPLKAEYFGKNGGNLGGNGNSMFLNGAKWERYHQTKLANSCFTAILASKLRDANLASTVKAVCAAPGIAQTNLQTTTQETSGSMSGGMWIMHFSQSSEDGSMPLITACFAPNVENGDFYEPKNGRSGLAVKVAFDKNSADAEQQKMLWETSEAACGTFSI